MRQCGGSFDDIGPMYHSSIAVQRGGGIGSFFGGLYRIVRPLLFRGARTLGREALKTGSSILSDIATKAPDERVGSIIRKRLSETVNRNMTGSGHLKFASKRIRLQSAQRGHSVKTVKRKLKKKKTVTKKKKKKKNTKKIKREKRDIFD